MKKREVLPTLNKCIEALVAMSGDAAKLEIMDNDKASRRLKKSISDFKTTELKAFRDLAQSIRSEINNKERKVRKKGIIVNLEEEFLK